MQFLTVYVREAHPGENMPAHSSYVQKRDQARRFKEWEELPWPVLVDEVKGTVHRAYGLLPNSVFLIDVDGRVAFLGDFSHGPTLRTAIEQLLAQGGRGKVAGGEDHIPHMLGAMTYGWDAIERGGEVSVRDVATGMPPLALNLWMGDKLEPLLDPIASRSRPIPKGVKLTLAAAALGLLLARSSGGEERGEI